MKQKHGKREQCKTKQNRCMQTNHPVTKWGRQTREKAGCDMTRETMWRGPHLGGRDRLPGRAPEGLHLRQQWLHSQLWPPQTGPTCAPSPSLPRRCFFDLERLGSWQLRPHRRLRAPIPSVPYARGHAQAHSGDIHMEPCDCDIWEEWVRAKQWRRRHFWG